MFFGAPLEIETDLMKGKIVKIKALLFRRIHLPLKPIE
jgi:hypothetical protein